jgi:predicted membrane protein
VLTLRRLRRLYQALGISVRASTSEISITFSNTCLARSRLTIVIFAGSCVCAALRHGMPVNPQVALVQSWFAPLLASMGPQIRAN